MSSYLLSKNFVLDEFVESSTASRLHIDNTPDFEVKINIVRLCKAILQPLRDALQCPIHVTSGYRCKALNAAVGGVPNSQHMYGLAADIVLDHCHCIGDILCELNQIKCVKVDGVEWNKKHSLWNGFSCLEDLRENHVITEVPLYEYDQLISYPSFVHVSIAKEGGTPRREFFRKDL